MRFPMATAAALLALLWCPGANAAGQRSEARTSAFAPTQARSEAAPRMPVRSSRRKPRIVHLPSPSEESAEQRDRRLARECRGLPNAGACLGHALGRPRTAAARR